MSKDPQERCGGSPGKPGCLNIGAGQGCGADHRWCPGCPDCSAPTGTEEKLEQRLQDALEDAIRRAYCEPIRPPVEGEDPDAVRSMAAAALISDPNRMRHLAAIQTAAWEVVTAEVELPAPTEGEEPERTKCPHPRCGESRPGQITLKHDGAHIWTAPCPNCSATPEPEGDDWPEEAVKAVADQLVDYGLADSPDRDREVATKAAREALAALKPFLPAPSIPLGDREVPVRFVGGGPNHEDEPGFTTLDYPPIKVEGGRYLYESFEDVDGESGEAIYRWEPDSWRAEAERAHKLVAELEDAAEGTDAVHALDEMRRQAASRPSIPLEQGSGEGAGTEEDRKHIDCLRKTGEAQIRSGEGFAVLAGEENLRLADRLEREWFSSPPIEQGEDR